MAVSVALNGGSTGTVRVSEATVKKVLKLAQELNYRPNAGARAIRTQKFRSLGYFDGFNGTLSFMQQEVERGICDRATVNDYGVNLVRRPLDLRQEKDVLPRIFREYQVDALLVGNTHLLNPLLIDGILTSGYPIIYVNEKRPFNAIYFDEYNSFRHLVMILIQRGFKRLAYLSPDEDHGHYSIKDRAQGYLDAAQAAGLEPRIYLHSARPTGQDYDLSLYEWMKGAERPDVVICYDDIIAFQFQRVASQLGLRIPEDLAVATTGPDFMSALSPIPLTVMELFWLKMGQAAADMAIQLVAEKRDQILSQVLSPKLLERRSTQRSLSEEPVLVSPEL